MKNRICLAWFGDLDSPDHGRKKSRAVPSRESPPGETPAPRRAPEVKAAEEPRRMFGRR